MNRPIRSKVVRLLRRSPIVFDALNSARKLVFRLIRQRKLRRLGYLIGSEQSPVASSKLKTDGLLTHTFALTDYRQALAALAGRSRTPAIKVAFRHSPD